MENVLSLSSKVKTGEPALSAPETSQEYLRSLLPEASQENRPSLSFKNIHSLIQKSVRKTFPLSRPKFSQEKLPCLIQRSVRTSPLSHPEVSQQNLPPLSSRSRSREPPLSGPEDSEESLPCLSSGSQSENLLSLS